MLVKEFNFQGEWCKMLKIIVHVPVAISTLLTWILNQVLPENEDGRILPGVHLHLNSCSLLPAPC